MLPEPTPLPPKMTVGQLIEWLSQYPPETLVLVDGYEDGMTEPKPRDERVVYRPSPGWWSGDWDTAPGETGDDQFAVVIGR